MAQSRTVRLNRVDELVFLFDVDNTLIDNDRIQSDLKAYLAGTYGEAIRDRYWAIYQERFAALGYADYFGAVERCRLEAEDDPRLLTMAGWLIDYPFADRIYPGALEAVRHVRRWGRPVLLSDGDAIYQPRKIERSGLRRAFDGDALVFVHKEKRLDVVERLYPARRYVLIDDKLRILAAVKAVWGERVTTVFPRQGQYANDDRNLTAFGPADMAIAAIGDIVALDRDAFSP